MDTAMGVEDVGIVHSGLAKDVLDNSIGGFGIFSGQTDDDNQVVTFHVHETLAVEVAVGARDLLASFDSLDKSRGYLHHLAWTPITPVSHCQSAPVSWSDC
jgi:hypothetical protein